MEARVFYAHIERRIHGPLLLPEKGPEDGTAY
jgi:hypothetical protein